MVPTHGWVWAQMSYVPTSGCDGVVYDVATLTDELQVSNPIFTATTLCTLPHWQKDPMSFLGEDTLATVLFAYVDPDRSLTNTALT